MTATQVALLCAAFFVLASLGSSLVLYACLRMAGQGEGEQRP